MNDLIIEAEVIETEVVGTELIPKTDLTAWIDSNGLYELYKKSPNDMLRKIDVQIHTSRNSRMYRMEFLNSRVYIQSDILSHSDPIEYTSGLSSRIAFESFMRIIWNNMKRGVK
jgi:hypothetical protein